MMMMMMKNLPSDLLPLLHPVPILGQLQQLSEHRRSFFHITLTLGIKEVVMTMRMTMRMIMRMILIVWRMILVVIEVNSAIEIIYKENNCNCLNASDVMKNLH